MPRRLRPAMNRKELWSGNGEVVFWIVALKSGHIGDAHASGQKGVFPVGLLAAAPARISENIQVGRPKIQPAHDSGVSLAGILHVFYPPLDADLSRHRVECGRIKAGRQSDGLRILGDSVVNDSMQRLTPPL